MIAQRNELMKQLPGYGWEIELIETPAPSHCGPEWFIDELWVIESLWSPRGLKAYVTFVVDPQAEFERKKGQGVWAVKASLQRPSGWGIGEDEVGLTLGRGWEKRLTEFMKGLSVLRLRGKQYRER
jgi:hypothetical protein